MSRAPKRVLVTRPEPGTSETALRLKELGLQPIKLPLQETQALAVPDDAVGENIAAVAVTSANAIRHASPELLQRLRMLPCFAVGEATAGAAQAAGFADVTEAGGDVGTLAGTIAAMRPAGRVVYLCGSVRRPLFEQRLSDAGVTVVAIETYCTAKRVRPASKVLAAAGEKPIDVVLLYSVNAAEALVETISRPGLENLFESAAYLCLSPRIAEALAGKVNGRILAAAEPSETALLSLIHRIGEHSS